MCVRVLKTIVLVALVTSVAASRAIAQIPAPAGALPPTIELSMERAVQMALETSLGLKSERLNVDIAAQSIAGARSAFLPFATMAMARNQAKSPLQIFEDGTSTVGSSTNLSGSGQISQRLKWHGASYQVSWLGNRASSAGSSSTYNPRLGSTLRLAFSQPLWRGYTIDSNRAAVDRAERQSTITDIQLEQQIVSTEASVRFAYLGLVAAIEGLKVAQQNMDLAEQSLRNSRARVAVGQSPQIDIITAEAAVESNRERVIVAEAQISTAEDVLRERVLDQARPDYWTVRLQPTDAITLTPRQVDVDQAIQQALANRLDLQVTRRTLEITDLNLALSKDQTNPAVDLSVDYAATGSGGRQVVTGVGVPSRGFGSVLGDAFGAAYPSWTVGVTVAYPLGRTSAETAYAQGQIQKTQQQLSLRQLELSIVNDVRQAGRDVQTSYQRVQASGAARLASERQLDAEERKFAVGMSDQFQLQTRQSQLASARVNELNAIIAYNRALIDFDRVQKTR